MTLGALLVFGAGAVSAATGMTTIQVPQAVCPPATARTWSCDAVRLATERLPTPEAQLLRAIGAAQPKRPSFGNGQNGGYAPQDLAAAYGVNPAASTSQVVGIVDAYNDPSVISDLDAFDAQYGLPPETVGTTFDVVNESGTAIDPTQTTDQPTVPLDDVGWAGEITLDVDTVRGLCHACKIVLVEASTNDDSDLSAAVNEAVTLGATIVSNSYGGPESPGEDSSAYNHPGVAILASSGDFGWYSWDQFANTNVPNTPASFPTVVGVGGTSLSMNSGATARTGETVWNDDGPEAFDAKLAGGSAGGGCSTIYQAPPWEAAVAGYGSLGCGPGLRSGVDVAADADYFTGYDTYETTLGWCTGASDQTGNDSCPAADPDWETYGGTSLASPLVAAIWALAGGPQGVAYPALTLYGHFQTTPSELNDVTSGGNGYCDTDSAATCESNAGELPNLAGVGLLDCRWDANGNALSDIGQCNAGTGFDGPTGLGTPNGLGAFQPLSPVAAIAPPSGITQGVAATFSGAGSSAPFPGDSIAQYVWSWGDGTTTTASSPTTTHTYTTPGAKTVTLTVTDAYASDNDGRTGVASSAVTVIAVYALTVSRAGSGKGSVSSVPTAIACPSTCSASEPSGTALTLTAKPASGSTFAGWSGACAGKGLCHVTLSSDKTVTAKFAAGCVVPRVTGDTLARAKSALKKARCAVGKVTHVSSAKKSGKVVSQRPGAGKKLPAGAKVNLAVGKRPRR